MRLGEETTCLVVRLVKVRDLSKRKLTLPKIGANDMSTILFDC